VIELLTGAAAAAVLRWIAFMAASVVCGVTACRWLLASSLAPAHDRSLPGLVRWSAWLVLGSAIGRMGQQALSFAASPADAIPMVGVLLQTPWGWAWAGQCVAAILLVSRPQWIAARQPSMGGIARQVLLTAAIVCAPAFQGHAIGAPHLVGAAVLADLLHLAAAGLWIGTLFVITRTIVPGGHPQTVTGAITRFSPWALTSAATLGATGTFAAWLHVAELRYLWGSGYGRMVLVKVALVATVGLIGAINWKRITPQCHTPAGVAKLRTSARAELFIAALVYLATAILVATPLPGE
jgi:putative copper export protein